jgi:hypothetical protein
MAKQTRFHRREIYRIPGPRYAYRRPLRRAQVRFLVKTLRGMMGG